MLTDSPKPPLRVMFLLTSMPVGGAETLLANLVRRLDRDRFSPEVACLKELGPLGEELSAEIPVHSELLACKYDLRVTPRLVRLFRSRRLDAVVTVGAGDKMFWGRLAARLANVPVVVAALHSTGWPDGVGCLNRMLTPLTDAFIAVAGSHADFLVQHERFPKHKVTTILNGVDTQRFARRDATALRQSLGIAPDAPVVGIVAALRPEKNHALFLAGAKQILQRIPAARFLVVGDGERRESLQQFASQLQLGDAVSFLGSRNDVPELLSAMDVLALTSHNEASPVSILEALSTELPVVAADVGSVSESVIDERTGRLFPAGDLTAFADRTIELLQEEPLRRQFGKAGRELVIERGSLESMVEGYQHLLERLHAAKNQPRNAPQPRAASHARLGQPAR